MGRKQRRTGTEASVAVSPSSRTPPPYQPETNGHAGTRTRRTPQRCQHATRARTNPGRKAAAQSKAKAEALELPPRSARSPVSTARQPRDIPPFLTKLRLRLVPPETDGRALLPPRGCRWLPVAVGGVVLPLGCPPRRRPLPPACRCSKRPAARPTRPGPASIAAADGRTDGRRPRPARRRPWTPCPAPPSSSTTAPGTYAPPSLSLDLRGGGEARC